jgi:signal transduction histidine kinase
MNNKHEEPGFRALLVEDQPALLEELRDFLMLHHLAAVTASDGAEALAMLAADRDITVVLSDIDMPVVDGLTLANRIVQTYGDDDATEVVLMTGQGTVDNAIAAVRAGAFDFLRKPVNPKDLPTVLRRAHAKASARRRAHAERTRLQADLAALKTKLAGRGHLPDLGGDLPPELRQILFQELRMPLISLLGVPDLLDAPGQFSQDSFYALLNDVRRTARRMMEISEDFIELLAPPDGRAPTLTPVMPERVLARLEAEHGAAARKAEQGFAIMPSTDSLVATDESRLVRSLGRLVANAITCTPAGGRIELAVHNAPIDDIAFVVRDTGPGMTAEQIDVARRPFWQVDMSLTRKFPGLGVQLASRMSERLGGRLEIQSVPGIGTTASIVLPRLGLIAMPA